MVKPRLRLVCLLAVALLPFASLSAKELAEYQVGDKAEEDIVASTKLSFIDTEETAALREKATQRVPIIVRYYTNAADGVEARFRLGFAQTRENFLNSVNKAFGHRQLSAAELGTFKFQSLAILFQKQNDAFPVSTNRAAIWASGGDDKAYQDSLVAALRQAMSPVIHPELISTNFRFGATVRLIPLGSTNAVVTEDEASQTSRNFSRTNFAALVGVRRAFINSFPREQHDVAKYLAELLEPNCAIDEQVTEQLRAKRIEGVWSVCDYEPGQVIARRGQVIDRKIKTALDLMKEKAVVGQLQELQVKQQAAVGELQKIVVADKAGSAQAQERITWLVGALAAVVVILAVAIWQLARRKQPVSLLPAPTNGGALEWQQRALVAEERTEKLQTAARAGLLAQLSQWLAGVLTQRLLGQRRLLLDTQSHAAAEMAELEARLERVQAPLQVRLAAYEHRIAELEKELAARGEENRELLKSKIEMMRKQLELERGKNRRMEFN